MFIPSSTISYSYFKPACSWVYVSKILSSVFVTTSIFLSSVYSRIHIVKKLFLQQFSCIFITNKTNHCKDHWIECYNSCFHCKYFFLFWYFCFIVHNIYRLWDVKLFIKCDYYVPHPVLLVFPIKNSSQNDNFNIYFGYLYLHKQIYHLLTFLYLNWTNSKSQPFTKVHFST